MYVNKGEKLCVRRMNNIKRLRNKMENKKGGDMKIKSVCAFLVLGLFIFMASMSNSRLAFSVETEKTKTEITPLAGVPVDFEVVYGFGATHAERGRTTYTITADGVVVIEKSKGRGTIPKRLPIARGANYAAAPKETVPPNPAPQPEVRQCKLTAGELAGLWKNIQDAKFFGLEKNYTNSHIMDGTSSYLTIKANGQEHSVTVINSQVKAYDQITGKIKKMISKKISGQK